MTCLTDPCGPSVHPACDEAPALSEARAGAPAVAAAVTPSVSATAAGTARSFVEKLLPPMFPTSERCAPALAARRTRRIHCGSPYAKSGHIRSKAEHRAEDISRN